MKKSAVAVAFALLAGCAGPPVATGDAYRVRHIGSTLLIESVPAVTSTAIGGAMIGTAIAAQLQSKPIPLKPGTDYACKYPDVAARLPTACPTNVPQQ
jgi:hypothetical protein